VTLFFTVRVFPAGSLTLAVRRNESLPVCLSDRRSAVGSFNLTVFGALAPTLKARAFSLIRRLWYCHPLRALQAYGPERGLSTYVGLIVTAPYRAEWGHDARQDWNHPRLHAWVLTNAFERWVCTPGRIDGW
jgi:hypothetical protein